MTGLKPCEVGRSDIGTSVGAADGGGGVAVGDMVGGIQG